MSFGLGFGFEFGTGTRHRVRTECWVTNDLPGVNCNDQKSLTGNRVLRNNAEVNLGGKLRLLRGSLESENKVRLDLRVFAANDCSFH